MSLWSLVVQGPCVSIALVPERDTCWHVDRVGAAGVRCISHLSAKLWRECLLHGGKAGPSQGPLEGPHRPKCSCCMNERTAITGTRLMTDWAACLPLSWLATAARLLCHCHCQCLCCPASLLASSTPARLALPPTRPWQPAHAITTPLSLSDLSYNPSALLHTASH